MDSFEADLPALRRTLAGRDVHRETLPDGAVRAAVAVVLVRASGERDPRTELLLIRRAERPGDPWSGHMALPGGRAEAADPDLAATARRETAEETGVILPDGEAPPGDGLIGELDDLRPTKSNRPRIVVRPFVFALDARPTIAVQAGEVAYHRWVSLAELAASADEGTVDFGPRRIVVPGFRLGEDFVWGMTHRILDPFLQLVRPR